MKLIYRMEIKIFVNNAFLNAQRVSWFVANVLDITNRHRGVEILKFCDIESKGSSRANQSNENDNDGDI